RILEREANGTRVQVTDPHHDAAADDERRGGEAELLGSQQRRDHHVAAGLELPVDLYDDPVAEPVQQQRLLGLRQAELPRNSGVLDRGEPGRAGAAVVTGDQHDVGVGLRHARGDRPDAYLRDELHVHSGAVVRVLQVVDQLLEIFDRVDVVVRWWRDEPNTGRRVPGLRDPRIHLVTRELATFTRLRALRHLDLQVVGVHQVLTRHAEAPRRDLLDRAAARIAVGLAHEPVGVLAA